MTPSQRKYWSRKENAIKEGGSFLHVVEANPTARVWQHLIYGNFLLAIGNQNCLLQEYHHQEDFIASSLLPCSRGPLAMYPKL